MPKKQVVIHKKCRAFSLIEILVVIAIIGILASVIIPSLSGVRPKAHEAKTLASMKSAQGSSLFCVEDRKNMNVPNIVSVICLGQSNWPAPVGDGWAYGDFGACAFDGNVSDGTFMFCASNGTVTISCTQDGCVKS